MHNVVVAFSSILVSNVGAARLSHDVHKLDHGKSEVNLMNPQILPTPVIAAKLSHYLEGYGRMLRNKIIKGFTNGFTWILLGKKKLTCT